MAPVGVVFHKSRLLTIATRSASRKPRGMSHDVTIPSASADYGHRVGDHARRPLVAEPWHSSTGPSAAWQDAVTYRLPDDPASKGRVTRAADWLKRHAVIVPQPEKKEPVRAIAWKDPTLAPEDPKLLAGYVITDTFWAAKALKPFDAALSDEMERGIQRLGWYGNGLQDVLFHPVKRVLHRSADEDFVHGPALRPLR